MTEEQGLLRAVLENPADDLARGVYADWLDDHPTPARQARAAFIRLQLGRAAGGRARPCPFCDGTGSTLGAAPDRGNPPCNKCGGEGVVVDLSVARQLAVAESIRQEGGLLRRWGRRWLPLEARGADRDCVCQSESITVLRRRPLGGAEADADRYVFDRGFLAFARLNVYRAQFPADPAEVGRRVRSILAGHPVEAFALENYGDRDTVNLVVTHLPGVRTGRRVRSILAGHPVEAFALENYGDRDTVNLAVTHLPGVRTGWLLFMAPLDRPSGGALIHFDGRRELVRAVPEFVSEFLPMARRGEPEPYTPDYYQEAGPLPADQLTYPELPDHVRRELDERDAEARNNVDAPHER
jgi:uncharacterized protein (TIGR02996 family)